MKRRPRNGNTIQDFWRKVQKTETCWIWLGHKRPDGYGIFHAMDGLTMRAHRFSYSLSGGYVPEGHVLDHLCRNPSCVNPSHLEPVTRGENVLRGIGLAAENARKEHCDKGHAFTPANTEHPYRRNPTWRRCRTCRRERQRQIGLLRRSAA